MQLPYRQVPFSTLAQFVLQFIPPLVLTTGNRSRLDYVVLQKSHLAGALYFFFSQGKGFGQKFYCIQTYPSTVQNMRNSRTTNKKEQLSNSPKKKKKIRHTSQNLINLSTFSFYRFTYIYYYFLKAYFLSNVS